MEFLPVALDDLREIVRYVSDTLESPRAAERLAEEIVEKAESLSDLPYACPAYYPVRPLKHEYRKLRVQNYIMFFWVDEAEGRVTVACIVYAKRDFEKLL